MTIVVISGAYFPIMNPPAACIDKYVQVLKDSNNVHIVCRKSTFNACKYFDKKLVFHYVTNWLNDLRNMCNWKIANNRCLYFYKVLLQIARGLGLVRAYFTYPTRDSWLINQYYKELCSIEIIEHVDVLISVSNPVCTHLAAQKFKLKYPNVRWITYSTDPFTYYSESYLNVFDKENRRRRNYKTEKSYYNDADYNIYTEELYQSAVNDFKLEPEKAFCFPYVFSDFSSCFKNIKIRNDSSCILIYAGALNKAIRNPDYMLGVLSKISKIKFYLYQAGDCGSILSKYNYDHIVINSMVKRDQYVDLICNQADILVNIGNNTTLQAPSKMLELLSTGKPILNFYYYKDSQYKMIERYPLGLNVGRDDIGAIHRVQQFCDTMRGVFLSPDEVKLLFPYNTLEEQLKILQSMF